VIEKIGNVLTCEARSFEYCLSSDNVTENPSRLRSHHSQPATINPFLTPLNQASQPASLPSQPHDERDSKWKYEMLCFAWSFTPTDQPSFLPFLSFRAQFSTRYHSCRSPPRRSPDRSRPRLLRQRERTWPSAWQPQLSWELWRQR
jgi:hypothetical protein